METIDLYNHLYNRDRDDDALTDYAFALLWFTRFIVTPRHTTRKLVTYSYYRAANYIKQFRLQYIVRYRTHQGRMGDKTNKTTEFRGLCTINKILGATRIYY